jgi:hypothetical protein
VFYIITLTDIEIWLIPQEESTDENIEYAVKEANKIV